MALSAKTLAELARLRAGVGPVDTLQATVAAVNGAPAVDGTGMIDVSHAVLCEIEVIPDAGSPVFTVWGRSNDRNKELNNLIEKTTTEARPWGDIVFCGPLSDLYVEVTDMGGATSVDLYVKACNG